MAGLRQALYEALAYDAPLTALGFGEDRVITQHDKDTQPTEGSFIVLRLLATTPAPFKNSPTNQRQIQIWVHDRASDFGLIDSAIERIKDIMKLLENSETSDEKWIQDVRWQGDSDDFRDDEARTINRYCQWLITGSAAT